MYSVCPSTKCSALYKVDDCNIIKVCSGVSFGKVCGASLGYEANLAYGRKRWKSFKSYHFYAPSEWLKRFFSQREFVEFLHQGTGQRSEFIGDVYDGQIWKDFARTDFFNTKYNLGLMLYVDWFKPFKRSEYTIGALMLSVLNLPRTERLKRKWTIVAGLWHTAVRTLSYIAPLPFILSHHSRST